MARRSEFRALREFLDFESKQSNKGYWRGSYVPFKPYYIITGLADQNCFSLRHVGRFFSYKDLIYFRYSNREGPLEGNITAEIPNPEKRMTQEDADRVTDITRFLASSVFSGILSNQEEFARQVETAIKEVLSIPNL